MEENVDFHDGEHEEETGDDDDDYDSVHADDTDGDDNNDCGDKEYDGSSKNYDVVLQEIIIIPRVLGHVVRASHRCGLTKKARENAVQEPNKKRRTEWLFHQG